jgi:TP901 family phage tail tape measure protein
MSDIIISVDGDTRPLESKLGKISSRTISLNLKDSLSQPLGRITGKVSEFDKSLEASNARVLAFGASAGAVYAVQKAFSEVVKSTIEVEKSLADINVVLNASSKDLERFSNSLFSVAKNTGQSFDAVAKAATEFARQGLGIQETLKRTSDALILSRLSGLDAAKSVETLTAAVNTFSRAGLTSTQVINKLANVDASFAVSTGDLAEAISRVGSTAQDVGVDIDQLIALVTSAQQTTARGGAVIGNSFKTIFTRIQRSDTLDALEGVGVAVRDLQGNTLPAIQVLQNLSKVFYTLSESQRASIAETVGGVFQINILRAALSDLGKEYNTYNSALGVSRSATDQAIKRNEALNQTLSALTNKTLAGLMQSAAKIGEITIAPTLKMGMGGLNAILEEFNKPQETQGVGTKIATGVLTGIGNYFSGPGLALVGMAFIKIFGGLTKFSAEALKSLLGIASSADKIAAAQERVNAILAQNPSLIQAIISKESSLLQVEGEILKIIQAQNAARAVGANVSSRISPAVAALPMPKVKVKSHGHIPNFAAAAMQEMMGAYAGGYEPGDVKKTNGMYYNTAESLVQFPGANGPAIVPPQNSDAGKNYRKEFQRSAGFDPYASNGFIPNFADKPVTEKPIIVDPGINTKVGMIYPKKADKADFGTGIAEYGKGESKQKVQITFPKSGYNVKQGVKPKDVDLEKQLGDKVVEFTNSFASRIFQGSGQQPKISSIEQLSNKGAFRGVTGAVFESAVGLATDSLNEGRPQNAPIDFAAPTPELQKLFNGLKASQYEAKVNAEKPQLDSVAQKILNLGLISGGIKGKIAEQLGSGYKKETKKTQFDLERHELERIKATGGLNPKQNTRLTRLNSLKKDKASAGFIPNFSALQEAMQREQAAGINPSQIRVGSDSSLAGKDNPYGLGVYNTKDEPAGLKQGINRSKGHIPNFAMPVATPGAGSIPVPEMKELGKSAKDASTAQEKHTAKMQLAQGKLLAFGMGMSILQGSMMQFGDQTSKLSQVMNQATGVISTATTGLGVFGTGKGGIAATGGMLAMQGVAGLSASADKPYTTQIAKLNTDLDKMRESAGKLDGVVSQLTPTLNEYTAEMEKSLPDQAKVKEFKSSILNSISALSPEMQQSVMKNINSPKEVQGTLAKAQQKSGAEQTEKQLSASLTQKQLSIRQGMGAQGQIGRVLTSVPGMSGIGERMMNRQGPENAFNQQEQESIAGDLLSPLTSTAEGTAALANSLAATAGNANDFFKKLQDISTAAGVNTESFGKLNSILASSPQSAGALEKSIVKSLEAQIKKAKELAQVSGGGATTSKNYTGISKLFGNTKEDLLRPAGKSSWEMETASAGYLYSQTKNKPGLENLQGEAAGQMMDQLNKGGVSLEQIEKLAPSLSKDFQKMASNRLERQKNVMGDALIAGGAKPEEVKKLLENFKPPDAAETLTKELFGELPADITKMGTFIVAQTAEQVKANAAAVALTDALTNLRSAMEKNQNPTANAAGFAENATKEEKAKPDIVNSALAGGGIITAITTGVVSAVGSSLVSKMLGTAATAAPAAVPAVTSTIAGAAAPAVGTAVGTAATTAATTAAGTAAPAVAAATGLTTVLGTIAAGLAAFAGGAAVGYGVSQISAGKDEQGNDQNVAEKLGGAMYNAAPSLFGGNSEQDQQALDDDYNKKLAKENERSKKIKQQKALESAPKVDQQTEDQAKSAETIAKKEAPQQNQTTNINVAPSVSVSQVAATDKAELQKMIEAEVKKFGETIIKIADDRSKARSNGTVNPPQAMQRQMG